MASPFLPLVAPLVLKSVLAEVIVMLKLFKAYTSHLFPFFPSFYFRSIFFLYLNLKCVCCRQHVLNAFSLSNLKSLPFDWSAYSSTFNIITGKVVLRIAVFLFVSYLPHLFAVVIVIPLFLLSCLPLCSNII